MKIAALTHRPRLRTANLIRTAVWLFATILLPLSVTRQSLANDLFVEQVKPLLERRCLGCHNDTDLKGGLSLETRQIVLASGALQPGDPAASHLLAMVTGSGDQRAAMPPNGAPLTTEELQLLSDWIRQGATWPDDVRLKELVVGNFDWWSLKPIASPAIPEPSEADRTWVRTPIDAFVIKSLRDKGLAPSPEADRLTLIRRVTFDLTGLPPTPDEVQAFLNDQQPHAYERLVDRLLASPRSGEKLARRWLDVARYADTCGYDKDKLRPHAWPYRDYVIRAFNTDKPYARFVEEQIAGDILYPDEPDSIPALGFLAAGPWDFIGHVEVPESKLDGMEARNLDRDEMATAVLNAFCSVTLQCARCHNHKFDPITQEHYYALQSVFAAVDRADRPYDADPETARLRKDLQQQLTTTQTALRTIDADQRREAGPRLVELDEQIAQLRKQLTPVKPQQFGAHSDISNNQDAPHWWLIDLGVEHPIHKVILHPCHDDFAGIGAGFGFPVRYRIETALHADDFHSSSNTPNVFADRTQQDIPSPALNAVEHVTPNQPVTARYLRLSVTRRSVRQNDWIAALAEVEVLDAAGKNLAANATITASSTIEAAPRWSLKNLTDGLWPTSGDPQLTRQLASLQTERDQLWNQTRTPERLQQTTALTARLESLQKELAALPPQATVYAAATQFAPQGNFKPTRGQPRTVHVLHRGNVAQPKAVASPGTIPLSPETDWQFALPAGHSEGERRVALARWITSKDNPLTWRSIVNRIWQQHFNQPLVASANDFGRMGQQPTHPELLDWLATHFRDHGQSQRELRRMLVTSSTYRQASADRPDAAAIDRTNQYLWKMDRRRLEAEEIRDAILMVSGQLNLTMGGPGYYEFVLEKPEHSPHYRYDKFDPADPASHRRSIYRFVVRSQPDPFMSTLDCADSSQSTPQRDETLTALQALSLLNGKFTLVMSERFADRLSKTAPTLPEQIATGFQLVTGRGPNPAEAADLESYARTHGLPALCRVLINLSEFVYVD